jgi:hypothetical protein
MLEYKKQVIKVYSKPKSLKIYPKKISFSYISHFS